MKLMKATVMAASFALSAASFAAPYFYNGALTANSPTYTNPGGQSGGNQAYSVFNFTVDVSGAYIFEMASPNTATAGSNALDTFLAIYANSFTPAAPGAPLTFNDDFTGAFTVLPGPYVGTVGPSGTGFTGAQPASRMSVNLTAGTSYFLINTSFRPFNYVPPAGGTTANGIGSFYQGINGPGTVTPVPEPATMLALAAGLGAVLARRRRK